MVQHVPRLLRDLGWAGSTSVCRLDACASHIAVDLEDAGGRTFRVYMDSDKVIRQATPEDIDDLLTVLKKYTDDPLYLLDSGDIDRAINRVRRWHSLA